MSSSSFSGTTVKLSIMMFLQFFIWGAWYTMVGQYLTKVGMVDAVGWVYTVGPIAAIIAPLFLGMVADRFFASQKVLAVLMVIGGIAMFMAPGIARSCGEAWATTLAGWESQGLDKADQMGTGFLIFPPLMKDHLPFIGILLLHMLCYMPTLGLTNSIAFRNIENGEKQFPVIRVFGTIGWIVAGAILGNLLKLDETATPLYITGGACLVLAVFALFLPNTPPAAKGKKSTIAEALGLGALRLLKDPSYLVFMVASMLICIPLAAYYAIAAVYINHSGFASAGGVMIWGQISEIVFMLLIPVVFSRFGVKWMLAIGMACWVLRYGLFSISATEGTRSLIFLGILLHGICYDFFFVTGFIYTDKKAPKEISGQAQGLLVLATQGLGLGLGAPLMAKILGQHKAENGDDLIAQGGVLRDQSLALADGSANQAADLWEKSTSILLQAHNWKAFWLYPAAFALVVLVVFIAVFRQPKFEEPTKNYDVS